MKPDVLDQLLVMLGEVCQRMIEREERRHTAHGEGSERAEPVSEALQQLRRGEITSATYLDLRVDAAMRRLRGLLAEDDFSHVRAVLRDRIETDPELSALARRLTSR